MLQACVLTRAYTLPVSCGVLTVMLVALVIMCAFFCFVDTSIINAWLFRLSTSLVLQYLMLGIVLRKNYLVASFSVDKLWRCISCYRNVCY